MTLDFTMNRTLPLAFGALILCLTGARSSAHGTDTSICPLASVGVSDGMNRGEVEARVMGIAKGTRAYSPYANNLQGGVVTYRGEHCDLVVEYNAGAPAPTVSTAKGAVHLPPQDETVKSVRVTRHSPQ